MGRRHRPLVPLLLTILLSVGFVVPALARDTPTAGDRWGPIDPATILSRATVTPDPLLPQGTFRTASYEIRTLPWNRLALNGMSLPRLTSPAFGTDEEGIAWKVVNGRNYYHPGNIADEGIRYVDGYVRTGNPAYLDFARVRANKLRELGVTWNGALFIPYGFDYPAERLRAPWYSAYSQGFALSLFVRLYRVTGESQYLEGAQALFRSFRQLGPGTNPWVAYVRNGELWFELYPSSRPTHVLNGFNFATLAVYEYERLTRDPAARQLLQGALSTIRRNSGSYRVPDEVSLYDLVHRTQLRHYHDTVVWQLRDLNIVSRDPYFGGLANVLEADGN